MSKRFETLFALDKNLYAAGSPVIVSAGVLLRDTESNRLAAQLKFRNVTSKTIWALTVTLACVDTGGTPTAEDFTYQYQDLTADRGEEFGSKKAILIPNNNTRGFRITEITAVFSDGSTQTAAAALSPLPEMTLLDSALSDRQLVKQYRLATNESALYVPVSKQGLQLCPCGSWHTQPFCSLCGLSYTQAEAAYDLPTLTAEMNLRLDREEAEREEARRAEIYAKALKTMDNAKLPLQLQKAEKDLDALGDYENSAELADTCRQLLKQMALKRFQEPKNIYDLKEAEKIFLHLGDMDGCAELAEQCRTRYEKGADKLKAKTRKTAKRIVIAAVMIAIVIAMIPISINYIIPAVKYAQAEKYIQAMQYDEAIAAFEALGDYKDAADRIPDVTYAKAEALLAEGSYTDASALFKSLGSHADSKSRVQECAYLYGCALMGEKQYEDAITQFKSAKNFEDAPQRIDSCYVTLAETEYAAQNYSKALDYYNKVSKPNTSDETYIDCLYQAALSAFAAEDFYKAVNLFGQVSDYADSAAKRQEAMYAYITANKNNSDENTFNYLKELKEQAYMDTADLFESLYVWSFTVTANTSKDNTENTDSIAKNKYYYFHIFAAGGQPHETMTIYATLKTPNGKTTEIDPEEVKNGDHCVISCAAPYKAGTATLTVYDSATSNVLATHNVRFK